MNTSALGPDSSLALRVDLARATRGVIAFFGPVLFAQLHPAPNELVFAAIAAQNIAFFEVRGDYRLRMGVVVSTLVILGAATAFGAASGFALLPALAAAALVAACMGLWRHLSSDYGPSLAISSMLLFLIAQETAPVFSAGHIGHAALWTLGGGAWGLLVQIVPWLFRPQQPLRASVAECWSATAALFEAHNSASPGPAADRHSGVMEKEAALRTTLDKTYALLAASQTRRSRTFLDRLNRLAHLAARLAMRVGTLHTAVATASAETSNHTLAPAFQPVLVSLTNVARTVSLAVVSRQPAHLALAGVRLRRLAHLLDGFEKRLDPQSPATAHLPDHLTLVRESLAEAETALRETIDRSAERTAFSLELTDTDTWSLRPLGAALNLTRRIDPVLVRFTIRVTFLTVLGAALAHWLKLPHGYWLPFTVIVVLQPDYGATRVRAAQRVSGTVLGSFIAIGILWLALPSSVLFAMMTLSLFAFGFFMKRDYSIGVLFVTIFVVLLTTLHQPVTATLAWERLASNVLGGAIALIGAVVFWPMWERRRLPGILATALRANLAYWETTDTALHEGRGYDERLILAKRRVETANAAVFASLQRLAADPQNRRAGLEQAAALANGNQRLTRAFSLLALQCVPGAPLASPAHDQFSARLSSALAALANTVAGHAGNRGALRALHGDIARSVVSPAPLPVPESPDFRRLSALATQRPPIVTETLALLLAAEACVALGLFPDDSSSELVPAEKRIS